jgi:AraC-like DNA-binding protein/mannose-6-phosphate isomerase-like protein (cupin superfamily)
MRLQFEDHRGYRIHKVARTLNFGTHIHNEVEIVLMTSGSTVVHCGGKEHQIRPGELFIAFPNQIHSYEKSQEPRGFLLIVPLKPYLSTYSGVLLTKKPVEPVISVPEAQMEMLLTLLEFAYAEKESTSETVMQSYLQLIVGKILTMLQLEDTASGADEVLKAVILYVNAHYTEPLTRAEIAKAVGYNESYISHLFSETLKTSIPNYINTLRIYDATKLLRQTDLPVSTVANTLGFGTLRNFNRVFLKETGKSPKEYRAAVKLE